MPMNKPKAGGMKSSKKPKKNPFKDGPKMATSPRPKKRPAKK